MWAGLAVAALAAAARPPAPAAIAVVRVPEGCRLGAEGSAAPCPCRAYPARVRLLLGLPLPLNSAGIEDLQAIPGIGPVRALAITTERERGGPFASVAALERARGVGPVTAQRLSEFLFVGEEDPACSALPPVGPF
ncbi:MAG: helix-hairpin-helix domain-containing protein [Myxococcota bacterium]